MNNNTFIRNPHLEGGDIFWQGDRTGILLIHGFTATTAEAVSYTHLDVYKRQTSMRSASKSKDHLVGQMKPGKPKSSGTQPFGERIITFRDKASRPSKKTGFSRYNLDIFR